MFRFCSSVKARLLKSGSHLLLFDMRSGDTIALECRNAELAAKLLDKAHNRNHFESALRFEPIGFKKACDLKIIEKV